MAMDFLHPLTPVQKGVVEVLEETLETAKAGQIEAIGIVVCMKDGYASAIAGKRAADLNLGCDSLKRKILDAVENAGSKILKARAS
jgi:hypothetical protein